MVPAGNAISRQCPIHIWEEIGYELPHVAKMKSDLFEALEMLRTWYLEDQAQRKQEMDRVQRDIISKALRDGEGVSREE